MVWWIIMPNSLSEPLDKRRFFIQIGIAVCISIFFQFVLDPYIYDPYIRDQMTGLFEAGDAIVICSLSMWFFSFSLAFFYYKNELLTNYLICSFIPLLIIVIAEFTFFLFYDFLHIPPVIVVCYILCKYRQTIRLKYVALSSLFLILWATTVRLLGTNYTAIALFPLGLLAIICWPLMNLFFALLIKYFDKKHRK